MSFKYPTQKYDKKISNLNSQIINLKQEQHNSKQSKQVDKKHSLNNYRKIFESHYELGCIYNKLKYYNESEANFTSAQTFLDNKVQMDEFQNYLFQINLKYHLSLIYRKTGRQDEAWIILKEQINRVNIGQFSKDGYLAYSCVESIFLSAAKMYFEKRIYQKSLYICEQAIDHCEKILNDKSMINRQMKLIAKKFDDDLESKYRTFAKLYQLKSQIMFEFNHINDAQLTIKRCMQICVKHLPKQDEYSNYIRNRVEYLKSKFRFLEQDHNVTFQNFTGGLSLRKNSIFQAVKTERINQLVKNSQQQFMRRITQRKSAIFDQQNHEIISQSTENEKISFMSPQSTKVSVNETFLKIRTKFNQSKKKQTKINEIFSEIQQQSDQNQQLTLREFKANTNLLTRPKSERFYVPFKIYQRQDSKISSQLSNHEIQENYESPKKNEIKVQQKPKNNIVRQSWIKKSNYEQIKKKAIQIIIKFFKSCILQKKVMGINQRIQQKNYKKQLELSKIKRIATVLSMLKYFRQMFYRYMNFSKAKFFEFIFYKSKIGIIHVI